MCANICYANNESNKSQMKNKANTIAPQSSFVEEKASQLCTQYSRYAEMVYRMPATILASFSEYEYSLTTEKGIPKIRFLSDVCTQWTKTN